MVFPHTTYISRYNYIGMVGYAYYLGINNGMAYGSFDVKSHEKCVFVPDPFDFDENWHTHRVL